MQGRRLRTSRTRRTQPKALSQQAHVQAPAAKRTGHDEEGHKGGKAHFRFHHDDCNEQADSEDFSDPGSGTDFHSTPVDSATLYGVTHSLSIAGVATGLPNDSAKLVIYRGQISSLRVPFCCLGCPSKREELSSGSNFLITFPLLKASL